MSNSIEQVIEGLEDVVNIAAMLRRQSSQEALASRLEAASIAILDGLIHLSSGGAPIQSSRAKELSVER